MNLWTSLRGNLAPTHDYWGTDAEGNHCNWTDCGLNATTPDQFFGGCGATAGTIRMTGP